MIAIDGVSVGRFSGYAEFDALSISSARSFGLPMNRRVVAHERNPLLASQFVELSVFLRRMTPVNIFSSCVMRDAAHVSSSAVILFADGVELGADYLYSRSSPGSAYVLDPTTSGGYLLYANAVYAALADGYVTFKAQFSSGLGAGYEISDLTLVVD